ncbi:fatty acyl-CoA reductase [Hahella aquimaris]|uniref:fatty acyl-CoA reductase n=1 Tax=Hahella sp. HNIBRBA332 TaxID=3015983 RepID=UPI00273C6A9A|nr:fatty acyl-CoA reductase [Hahella sp. HNIBRBA332]WLQ14802.1 fatty acyl-CoA reductase [Hahella sp. HNIBRBA332]
MKQSLTLTAFANKNVLITGTTGFVGKVVLEKLLRSVPTIGKIYLLIRGNSKNPTARKRFQNEIATSSIFDTLKASQGSRFEELCETRIHCVTGEVTEPLFGLSEKDFTDLAADIDIIINSAASVNFREALDQALTINTLCLKNIIELSRRAGDCPVVQVSTCYVNGFNQGVMEEDIVSPAGERMERSERGYYEVEPLIARLLQDVEQVSAAAADDHSREKDLIDLGIKEANKYGWNDTYTFTKWMGEQLLMKELHGKTLTILRPSIVESTLQGPVPGWIEGVKVADAIILAYAREKVSLFPGKKNAVIDIIPADLVANSIILSATEALLDSGAHRIYQCCSSEANPIRIREVIGHVQQEAEHNYQAHDKLFYRKPKKPFVMIPGAVFHALMAISFHMFKWSSRLQGLFGRKASGRKLSNMETTMKLSKVFSFYTSPSYTFSNRRLQELSARLGEYDQSEFPVNAGMYDWAHYLREVHVAGLNKYALRPKVVKMNPPAAKPRSRAA